MTNFFHAHAHSRKSSIDAMTNIPEMVEMAKKFKQPAVALTDHGNLSGAFELYRSGKKHGIPVYPGIEGYLVEDMGDGSVKIPRFHIGLLSLNFDGYKALINLSSMSHTRPNFSKYPRFDLRHLAELGEDKRSDGIAVLTGCYFGLVQQTLVHQGYEAARGVVEMYAGFFNNVFVEIQNHNIDHSKGKEPSDWTDEGICEAMVSIADEVGLPILATQDSHYPRTKDKVAHSFMKMMVYRGDPGENEFPGDSFHFSSTDWVEDHHDPDHWKRSEEGFKDLLSLHDLSLPALDTYKVHVPTTAKMPTLSLRRGALKGLEALEVAGKLTTPRKRYTERLEYELGVISDLGMAGYFMLCSEVVQWCHKKEIAIEARGSANSSLVCYLTGITSVDPLEWGLLFERFLSRDRVKPPDIDMDVEDRRRVEVVGYLQNRFGVMQIGTFAALGAREEDDRGSVLVTYNQYLRGKYIDQYGKSEGMARFNAKFGSGGFISIEQVGDHSYHDFMGLRELAKHNVTKSYGVHAAGLLLNGDDLHMDDYIPHMLVASSDTKVTQMTMDDVETAGFLKMDWLGQRTLTSMVRTQELILEGDYDFEAMGMSLNPRDFTWIPLNDRATCEMISEGRPGNGVFQFEGYSMAKGARRLKIKSTYDCILAQALFRPACIESGMTDLFIERRNNPSLRRNIWYPHPAFEEVLKPTNGIALFQEQVLEIMRRLGLSIEDITTFFKIVKDSGKGATERNVLRAAEVHKRWSDICDRNGITEPEEAWHFIEGYTKYGFGKGHSAGYGIRSYRAAFLKTHFPLEYMTATLESVAGNGKKEKGYEVEARHCGIHLMQPDVNTCGPLWTIDRKGGGIRRGLLSIDNIGKNSAEEIALNAPYASIEDMVDRVSGRNLTGGKKYLATGEFTAGILALKESGALSCFGIKKGD